MERWRRFANWRNSVQNSWRASEIETTDVLSLRRLHLRVGYSSNPCADTTWRKQCRLERIVPDQDVLAQISGSPVSSPGCCPLVLAWGITLCGRSDYRDEESMRALSHA